MSSSVATAESANEMPGSDGRAVTATAASVTVRASPPSRDPTSMTLSREEGESVAGTQGDPVKAVQALPGISRPSFGLGPLIVWGAAPRDTRVYVDTVEVPALYHGGGVRSTVGSGLVGSVELVPGAFGVDHGGGLGGVVNVTTRSLPAAGIHGFVAADPLDAAAMTSAVLGPNVRASVSARYGYLDRTLDVLGVRQSLGNFVTIPRYDDAQAKMTWRLAPREQLSVVFLHSADAVTYEVLSPDPAGTLRRNSAQSFQRFYLSYVSAPNDRTRVTVTPFYGFDRDKAETVFGGIPTHLHVASVRYGVRAERKTQFGSVMTISLGADVNGTRSHLSRAGSLTLPPREGDITVFGQPPGEDVNADIWATHIINVAPYARATFTLGPVAVTPGLRLDSYLVQGSRETPRIGATPGVGSSRLDAVLEPRLAVRYSPTQEISLSAAGGVYHAPPAPEDMSAVFGTPALTLSSAWHVTLGQAVDATHTTRIELTEFIESMSRLPVRSRRSAPNLARALVQDGEGQSFGAQILVRQRLWNGFDGWLAYTVGRSERRHLGDASYRLFDYDRTHIVSLVARQVLAGWAFSARAAYATGLPRTPVVGAYYDVRGDRYEPLFGAQNSSRLPPFFELDFRVDRALPVGEHATLHVYLEALNVTLRRNPEEVAYARDYGAQAYITGLPPLALVGGKVDF